MNDPSLSGKTAIVTGAGSGLGRAMTLALAAAGCNVAGVDSDEDRLAQLVGDVGNSPGIVHAIVQDLTAPDCGTVVLLQALATFDGVDALVNNAGVSTAIIRANFRREPVKFWDVPGDKWDAMFAINAKAAFLLAKEAVPYMIERGWGRVVNVTTSLDTMIRPFWTPYGPSKAALEAASANWAGDLKDTGVSVNVLIPGGPANTNFVPGITEEERAKLVSPDVMAEPIKWLLSEKSDGVTGRRFLAYLWDASLPPETAAEQAGAPIAWQSLGAQSATEPVPN